MGFCYFAGSIIVITVLSFIMVAQLSYKFNGLQ
jgi:hypothetical protein